MIALFLGVERRIAHVAVLAAVALALVAVPMGIGVGGAAAATTEEVTEQGGGDGAAQETGDGSATTEETANPAAANCAPLLHAAQTYGALELEARSAADRAIVRGDRDGAAAYLAMAVQAHSFYRSARAVATLAGCY